MADQPPIPGLDDRGLIGEGGWGQVRRVHDRALNRDLAMKRLHAEVGGHAAVVSRFLAEARITARLDHPAIVPVHQLGQDELGAWFFTMKEVHGLTLAEAMRRRALRDPAWPLERLLEGFRRACEGVAFAHARGVVHRDLKPDNIMLGPFGEAFVLDWGIARDPGAAPDLSAGNEPLPHHPQTLAGRAIGTPGYMSPEHAGLGDFTPRTDVWSLGAVLHEILSGTIPTAGHTVDELVAAARTGSVRPTLGGPAELVSIARKALARDPAGRYPSAKELADELGDWLSGRPVPSHRYSLGARVWRWALVRRSGVLAFLGVGAAASMAVALFAVVVAVQWWWAATAEREARVNLGRLLATSATAARVRNLEPDATLLALAALEQFDDPRSHGVLAAAPPAATLQFERILDEKCRNLQWRAGSLWCAEEFAGLLEVGSSGSITRHPRSGGVSHLSWSAEGLRLESARNTPDVRVYDGDTALAHDAGHDRWTRALAFLGPDVWSSGQDGLLRRWEARSGLVRDTWTLGFRPERLIVAAGPRVVVLDDRAELRRFEPATGTTTPLQGRSTNAPIVEGSPSGTWLAAGGWIGGPPGLRVWDLRTDTPVEVPVLPSAITALHWASDQEVWAGDQVGVVYRCVLGAPRCSALRVDENPVYGIATEGDRLATLGLFGRLRLWSLEPARFDRRPSVVSRLEHTGERWWVGGAGEATAFDAEGRAVDVKPWCPGLGASFGSSGARVCLGEGQLYAVAATGGALPWTRPVDGHVEHLLRTETGFVSVGSQVLAWSEQGEPTPLGVTDAPGHDAAATRGRWLAVATSGTAEDTVDLVDLRGELSSTAWVVGGRVSSLAVGPDAAQGPPTLYAATSAGELRRWGPDGTASQPLGTSLEVMSFDPRTGQFAIGRNASELVVLPAFGEPPSHVLGLPSAVTGVAFGAGTQLLASLADGSLVELRLGLHPTTAEVEARSAATLDEDGQVRLSAPR